MLGKIDVSAVDESDPFFFEFGVLLYRATECIRLRQLTVFGDDPVAGDGIATRIGVEGMADTS